MRDVRDVERHSISGLHLVQALRVVDETKPQDWREFLSGQIERATKAFRRFLEQVKGYKLNLWKK
jgi:hypothetical protein